ncbi:ATP-binding protein [Rhodocytophaga aerolata]|uniref:histidine kinase n=1 Tax=Rhodocytophaga aerolata TaxID=455078 RepID=A0ABT8R3H0_9BACT|nr:PAS domain-containing hybrid sensor histidine kinase/response regulator [Rhodocytophaga aerolata]MDO1446640.1 ATP-binding protein [Rhodocytophaga aerolata]
MKEKNDKLVYQHFLDESFEDLYEHAPCGYFSSLPDGTIVKLNTTLAQWLGYHKTEILHQKRFQELLPIGGKIFYETHHAPLIRMQGSVNELSYDLVSKSGALLPVLINSSHVTDAEGKVVLYRSTLVNISDRKKYEAELLQAKKKAEQAAKTKAEFLSTVSHEIRTPMNAIIGVANLLQATDPSPRQLEYLRILKLSSENLLNLINDILDFNKIESGKISLEERPFNIRELLQHLIYNLLPKAEEKEITLTHEIDARLPSFLLGDPVKLIQVLTNLIGNAIKFTHTGSVTLRVQAIEVTSKDVVLEFKVSDTGIGIAADKIHKIFEEFSQADYEINLKYGGTGLGLAISKKLLALYNATLQVESELGKGSSFSFALKLPISDFQPESQQLVDLPHSHPGSLRGIKLLLAEDNSVNIFILSQYLKSWEVAFDVAEDGSEAIEKIRQHTYDLVLMDLQMPKLNGYDATRMVRNLPDEKFKKLPIIALSASSKFDLQQRLDYAGITDFIGKPFNPRDLYNKIALYSTATPQQAGNTSGSFSVETSILPPTDPSWHVNLNEFRKLTRHDTTQLTELIRLSIENFTSFQQNFKEALYTRDILLFEEVAHKSKMTLRSLEATRLSQLLDRATDLLQSGEQDTSMLAVASREISQEIDVIITELIAQIPDQPGNIS